MDINSITGAIAYERTSVTYKEEKYSLTETSGNNTTSKESSAAVYEKTTEQVSLKTTNNKVDAETIQRLQDDLEQRKGQLRNLVEQMLAKQGKTYTNSKSIWDMLRKGELEVDPEVSAQAQKDIAEDGYWGVEQTSERLVSFAKALAGDDPAYADKMISAMKKGFEQATKAWGGELPDICKQTIDTAVSKMEAWRDNLS